MFIRFSNPTIISFIYVVALEKKMREITLAGIIQSHSRGEKLTFKSNVWLVPPFVLYTLSMRRTRMNSIKIVTKGNAQAR